MSIEEMLKKHEHWGDVEDKVTCIHKIRGKKNQNLP